MENDETKRPNIIVGTSKTGYTPRGVFLAIDGDENSPTRRCVIDPSGFHFEPSDFSDFAFNSISISSPNGDKHTLSFNEDGVFLVDGESIVTYSRLNKSRNYLSDSEKFVISGSDAVKDTIVSTVPLNELSNYDLTLSVPVHIKNVTSVDPNWDVRAGAELVFTDEFDKLYYFGAWFNPQKVGESYDGIITKTIPAGEWKQGVFKLYEGVYSQKFKADEISVGPPKLEIGEPTPWSRAPEDIDKRLNEILNKGDK